MPFLSSASLGLGADFLSRRCAEHGAAVSSQLLIWELIRGTLSLFSSPNLEALVSGQQLPQQPLDTHTPAQSPSAPAQHTCSTRLKTRSDWRRPAALPHSSLAQQLLYEYWVCVTCPRPCVGTCVATSQLGQLLGLRPALVLSQNQCPVV